MTKSCLRMGSCHRHLLVTSEDGQLGNFGGTTIVFNSGSVIRYSEVCLAFLESFQTLCYSSVPWESGDRLQ